MRKFLFERVVRVAAVLHDETLFLLLLLLASLLHHTVIQVFVIVLLVFAVDSSNLPIELYSFWLKIYHQIFKGIIEALN
jgi:hypothetical protein